MLLLTARVVCKMFIMFFYLHCFEQVWMLQVEPLQVWMLQVQPLQVLVFCYYFFLLIS